MFDETVTTSKPPTVSILERGPRYSAAEIQTAFPASVPQLTNPPAPDPASSSTNPAQLSGLIQKAVAFYKEHEPVLWSGRWQDYSDPLTGEKPFGSQSSADYALCRRIGYWGLENGLSCAELPTFVETVFSQSGLANRDKWRLRQDYRDRTAAAACKGLTPPTPMFGSASPTAEPDWSLKGDLIASRFFKDSLGEQMKFIVSVGKWIRWNTDEHQWRWCELGEEVESTKQLVLELRRRAHIYAANNPDTGAKLTNEIAGLQRESRIRAVIGLAKSEPGISMEPKELDKHPDILGVRNGVVDLRTGRLSPNRPALLITKYVDIEYHEDADCPLFKSFLHEVFEGDTDTIDAVHRLAGLTMTGRTGEEVIVFCVGRGANGKSIFGNIMTSIMGQYAVTAPSSLLAARRADDHGPRSDLAMLHGKRLVSINELPRDMTLDETVAKQLAGREPISARFLHKEYFTFDPDFTPWVRTNHRPIIKGTDDGIWRRMVIVPFNRTFSPDEQDHDLEKKLRSEREGILVWLVQGATLYLKSGLKHSPAMRAEINQYRTDSDLLGEFLADHTTSAPDAEEKQSDLFMRYQLWCERNALRPCSRRSFTEQLKERGFGQRKSGAVRYYTGVKATEPTFSGGM
jgi:putative DNA primase/helicase